MKMFIKWFGLFAFCFFVAACVLFDAYDSSGMLIERGIFSQAAEGGKQLGSAGIPWAGLGGGVMGIIGIIGAYIKNRGKNENGDDTVKFLDEIKGELAYIKNDEDFEALILRYAPPGSKFGDFLKKRHTIFKAKKANAA